MKRICLEKVAKRYGSGTAAVDALRETTLTVEPGEFFFLLGPSGCGKTTLLRIVAGLTEPTGGRIVLGDRDVTDEPVEDRHTALVFQNYALWPHMTVAQNVEFGPKMRGVGRGDRRQLARDNLDRVQMGELAARKPNQLSGGQQQRVALARALAARPDCLLLDEPLSNLDARLRLHMREELRSLVKSTGTTAVYVTHDQKEALSMADRIAVMRDGRVVQVGSPVEVYNRPRTRFVADFLGEANFLTGRVEGVRDGVAEVETPVGRVLAGADDARPPAGRVLCCVRPERVRLSAAEAAPAPDGGGALSATVVAGMYLGEMRQYLCELPGGQRWRVSVLADSGPGLEPGRGVTLALAPEDVTLVPDEPDA